MGFDATMACSVEPTTQEWPSVAGDFLCTLHAPEIDLMLYQQGFDKRRDELPIVSAPA